MNPDRLFAIASAVGQLAPLLAQRSRFADESGQPARVMAQLSRFAAELLEELEILHEREIAPHFEEAKKERAERLAARRAKFAADTVNWKKVEGPKLWAEWHKRALAPLTDAAGEQVWLNQFVTRVRCGECKANFIRLLKQHPPHFGETDFDYFAYTVKIHNLVNVEAGHHLTMTVEEARAKWAA